MRSFIHKGGSDYHLIGGVSWTLPHEYYDSMILFLLTAIVINIKRNSLALVIIITAVAVYVGSFFANFMMGYAITMLNLRGYFNLSRTTATLVSTLLFYLFWQYAVQVPPGSEETFLEDYILWPTPSALGGLQPSCLISTTLFMLFVECCSIVQMFFSNRLSKFLGRISFMIYLYRILIELKNINQHLTGVSKKQFNENKHHILFILLRSIIFQNVVVSYIMTLLVDEPTVKLLRIASSLLFPENEISWKDAMIQSVYQARVIFVE